MCVVVIVFVFFWVIINMNQKCSILQVNSFYQIDLLDLLSCPPQDDLVVLITRSDYMLIL